VDPRRFQDRSVWIQGGFRIGVCTRVFKLPTVQEKLGKVKLVSGKALQLEVKVLNANICIGPGNFRKRINNLKLPPVQ